MPTECERSVTSPTTTTTTTLSLDKDKSASEAAAQQQHIEHMDDINYSGSGSGNGGNIMDKDMLNGEMSTSTGSTGSATNGHNGSSSNGGRKTSITSPDPTAYVAKARVTRPTPPPPSYNPMQFVQIKPCNLYQTAQQQLKKAEEVKKIKEIKKEEPEDWQNNLDNWKSSRRKRVEHIIDRVVEVKKLELEEHDRSRRKSKTFSEMIEERGERAPRVGRAKLASLAVYNEDESNDLSDLGIGTSSASGKSSLSEDYDNNSVMSDNADLDKVIYDNNHLQNSTTREYISSPGYDTSSSTAPASSPDPCEYTYEGAIQDYKQRVSRATCGGSTGFKLSQNQPKINHTQTTATPKETTPERANSNGTTTTTTTTAAETYPARRGSKIEERLIGFEVNSPNDSQDNLEKSKVDLPKIDISKRKEIFEATNSNEAPKLPGSLSNGGVPKVTLRDRFKVDAEAQQQPAMKKDAKRLSSDVGSIKDRLQSLEQQQSLVNSTNGATSKLVDVPVPPLKERLSSLQNAVTKEEVKKPPVVLVDARQLEIMKDEDETAKQRIKQSLDVQNSAEVQLKKSVAREVSSSAPIQPTAEDIELCTDFFASYAAAAPPKLPPSNAELQQQLSIEEVPCDKVDVRALPAHKQVAITGCFEITTDDIRRCDGLGALPNSPKVPPELEADRDDSGIHTSDDIDEEQQQLLQQTQEQQLNDAIAALALEEKQLEQAANAVNLIEAEFAELAVASAPAAAATATTATNDMEFSINEALELALEAIDKETTIITATSKTTTTTKPTKINTEISTATTNGISDDNCNKSNNSNNNNDNAIATSSNKINDLKNEFKNQTVNFIENELKIEQNSHVPIETQVSSKELMIQNEPIYENISATSTANVDVEVKIIPNNLNQIKNNQNISNSSNNKNNNNNNNNNKNSIKNNCNNNNKPLVDITNSLATTSPATSYATAEMLQETAATTPNKAETGRAEQPIASEDEPYYQVPKSSEPYYDAPKHLRPIPLYENIEIFYNGIENATLAVNSISSKMEPPKEKPPPPPIESPPALDDMLDDNEITLDNWSSDNTYETISNRLPNGGNDPHPSPPIKRMNSTKRIKKELRNKRSSFLGIEGTTDDDLESYLELTVAPPPDMAQLLQEERRLEKQLYIKAGLCDSSDTGESRDSGVSENHSRQSSEPYTNSSEEADRNDEAPLSLNTNSPNHILKQEQLLYQNEAQLLAAVQTPLLQTVKGNSAESWTESATAAAAATKSLTEATATANAKMLSIEEKIREQEEVLRVERELLQLEQEELKRQRENLMLRENLARRELQHGAKMLMSANRQSLQDLNAGGSAVPLVTMQHMQQPQPQQPMHHQHAQPQQLQQHPQQQQQIYANLPNLQQQYYQVETDYRKSMSDLNEFSKRLMLPPVSAPLPPTKPMRAMHVAHADVDYAARQRHSLNTQSYGGSLVKIAGAPITTTPMVAQRQSIGNGAIYSNYQQQQQQQQHHQSAQNLAAPPTNSHAHTNMTRNTLHALSATPKPKYTDGWVQVQNRKSYDSNLSNDPAWLSAYQQKRKSVPESYLYNNNSNNMTGNNHWLVQEAEQRRLTEQQQQQLHRRSLSAVSATVQQQNAINAASKSNGKPLPDSIIQTLTERVQSKGIGERKRFDHYSNNIEKSPLHSGNAVSYHMQQQQQQQLHPSAAPRHAHDLNSHNHSHNPSTATSHSTTPIAAPPPPPPQDKVLSVSGKKKCSHCGDELGRGAAMIIESLLLFYHINCFKCCVCHVQLGDGLNGTDVRVRNHKLHCQNCYSSDDGIKFSCV